MASETEQLVDEILQIMAQYQVEVPGKNRHWPRSIQERVVKLLDYRLPLEISEQTGISKSTIAYWDRRERGVLKPRRPPAEARFLPVTLKSTVESSSTVELKNKTATLSGPNGILIQDATPEFVAELFRLMGKIDGN